MKSRIATALAVGMVFFAAASLTKADTVFTASYTFPGGSIYGYPPVPQTEGFDYYFSPLRDRYNCC